MDSLVKRLKTDLRVVRPKKEGPGVVEGAAYLLDHERKTLAFTQAVVYHAERSDHQHVVSILTALKRPQMIKLLGSDYTTVTKRRVRTRSFGFHQIQTLSSPNKLWKLFPQNKFIHFIPRVVRGLLFSEA